MNIHQLSLDTVLAEWSTQLGKETSTFERILAHVGRGGQGECVRGRGGRGGQGEGVRGERGGQGEGVRGERGGQGEGVRGDTVRNIC